jgi:hypothetical protein
MGLEARYALLWSEWLALGPPAVSDLRQFVELEREVADLVELGQWESGPADLLSVLGRHGDELFHSSLIAWLAQPAARHGLGRQFVVRLFDRLWPGEMLAATGPVTTDTEVTNSGTGEDGHTQLASRADVIIRADNLVVVIENKVWAGEQPDQCERLYRSWVGEAQDVRWLFLTPNGVAPTTAVSDAAKRAWCRVSYLDIRAALSDALDAAPNREGHLGRATARQYLATLDAHTTFTGGAA